MEVEIRQATGQPVRPESVPDDELKLIAVNSLMRADEQKAIAPIAKTVTSAAQTLVNGVRKYNPVALAKMAAIKAKALAGDAIMPRFCTIDRFSSGSVSVRRSWISFTSLWPVNIAWMIRLRTSSAVSD